jgi:hypothetical protein
MSAPVNTGTDPNNQYDVPQVYSPVKVDLRAAIDASASVTVFGPSEETLNNVIWCARTMDVSALYVSSSKALFEFWEPSDNRLTIKAQISANRDAKARAQHFSTSLHYVLQGDLDASAANPFQTYGRDYNQYVTFGELALSYAAEGMFGHPSATAAITNDESIVNGFNSSTSVGADVQTAATPSQADQALAQRLAAKLYASNEATATAIAQSVLGQDAVRMTNDDNSTLQVEQKAALRFVAGDVVYVAITLKEFAAAIGGNSPLLQQLTAAEIATPRTEKYYLRIVLA